MAKVSELKERARALEQQGSLNEALAIYRHILNHLERTPAITHELALYVKVGDLSLKLGNPTWAVEMYERAAGHYVQAGSGKTIISLCLKIVRVDETRVAIFREYADRLVAAGHLQAAVTLLQEYARRVKMPEVFVRLQSVVDRPDEQARRGLVEALAELDGQPPPKAAVPTPKAPAAPAKPPPIGLITEPKLDVPPRVKPRPPAAPPPAPPVAPAVHRPAAATAPPEPPPVRAPPPLEVEPGPFAPPPPPPPPHPERGRARPSGPHRVSQADRPATVREPVPPARPRPDSPAHPSAAPRAFEPEHRPPATVVRAPGPSGGKVLIAEERRRSGRVLWIGVGAAALVVIAGLVVTGIIPLGKGPKAGAPEAGQPTTVPPAPAPTAAAPESAAAALATPVPVPRPPGVAQAAPADTGRPAPVRRPDTTPARPAVTQPAPAPAPAPRRVPAPPAPVTVQLPEGASVTGIFVVIEGLPIDSVTDVVMDGRAGHRVVQRLPTGETVVLTAVPVRPGADSVGLGEPQVMSMFGDVVGARRFWSYQVNVRGGVSEDVLSQLLGRLVRARGGS